MFFEKKVNTRSIDFEFIKEGDGRYEVYLVEPITRLGMVLGKTGNWCAEDTNGRHISCFNTRKDAANALLNVRHISSV